MHALVCSSLAQNKKKQKCTWDLTCPVFAKSTLAAIAGGGAFAEIILGKNIGRSDKLRRSCKTTSTEEGLSYGTGIVVAGKKLFKL